MALRVYNYECGLRNVSVLMRISKTVPWHTDTYSEVFNSSCQTKLYLFLVVLLFVVFLINSFKWKLFHSRIVKRVSDFSIWHKSQRVVLGSSDLLDDLRKRLVR